MGGPGARGGETQQVSEEGSSLTSLWRRSAGGGAPSPRLCSFPGTPRRPPSVRRPGRSEAGRARTSPTPRWAHGEPPALLPAADLPEAVGPRRVSLPQPQGPGVPLLLHPQLSPSLMFTNGARPPTGLSQGPGAAVRCLGAVSTPPPLALPTGDMGGRASLSDSRWAHPPFSEAQKRVMEKAGNLSDLCRVGWSGSR